MRRVYIRSTTHRHEKNDVVETDSQAFVLTGKTITQPDGGVDWEAEETNQGQFKFHTWHYVYVRFVYNHNIGEPKAMSVENATEPQCYRRCASAVAESLAKAYVTRAAELNKLAERMRFWKPGEEVDVALARLLEREERELRVFL